MCQLDPVDRRRASNLWGGQASQTKRKRLTSDTFEPRGLDYIAKTDGECIFKKVEWIEEWML